MLCHPWPAHMLYWRSPVHLTHLIYTVAVACDTTPVLTCADTAMTELIWPRITSSLRCLFEPVTQKRHAYFCILGTFAATWAWQNEYLCWLYSFLTPDSYILFTQREREIKGRFVSQFVSWILLATHKRRDVIKCSVYSVKTQKKKVFFFFF